MLIRAYRRAIVLVIAAAVALTMAPAASADEGYATWYGPGFHGNRMSNGQIFDMYDPTTTASNQYPLGTWLKVTNPVNGKSVWVQVRDRGPFGAPNLKLDLSYAASVAISHRGAVTLWVEYEVVPGPGAPPVAKPVATPAPAPAPTPARSDSSSRAGRTEPAPDQYTVQSGDTLWSIATRFGLSADTVSSNNGISRPEALRPGQTLNLKAVVSGPTATAVPAAASSKTHTVASGETLSGIADKYDMTSAELARLNGITNPNSLSLGQELKVAGSAPTAAPAAPAATVARAASTHTVAAGETLSGIADKYGMTSAELAGLNGITNPNSLSLGQELKVSGSAPAAAPAAPAAKPASTHTVAAGETLSGIADKYGMTSAELASLNGIDNPNALSLGQALKVSGSAPAAAAPAAKSGGTHTVAAGETLWDIAVDNDADVEELASLNGIDEPYILQLGQVLKLP